MTRMDEEPRPAQPRPAVPAGVIAVVRAPTFAEARAIVRGLILAAVPAVELTMTVPGAVRIIAEFAASALSGGTVLGAGSVGGAGYLRALREPLPGLRAVVSGGIAAAEVPGYLAAGAHAVCLGGALIDRAAARRGDADAVAVHARRILDEIMEADGHDNH